MIKHKVDEPNLLGDRLEGAPVHELVSRTLKTGRTRNEAIVHINDMVGSNKKYPYLGEVAHYLNTETCYLRGIVKKELERKPTVTVGEVILGIAEAVSYQTPRPAVYDGLMVAQQLVEKLREWYGTEIVPNQNETKRGWSFVRNLGYP